MFPVRIETPRLLLRELAEDDWPAVHAYARMPEVVKYEPWGPNTEELSREFVFRAILAQAAPTRASFELAVTLKSTGRLIGCAGLRPKEEQRAADLGYALRPDCWGQGFATEAARALVRFGFEDLGLHRIWATCHIDNKASARVLEKAGMKLEGVLRKNRFQRGEWRSSCLYAVLGTDPR